MRVNCRILTAKRRQAYLKLYGAYANAELGASVDGFADINSDDVDDLLVGAPGERRAADTTRTGVVHVLSGKTGVAITQLEGNKAARPLRYVGARRRHLRQ